MFEKKTIGKKLQKRNWKKIIWKKYLKKQQIFEKKIAWAIFPLQKYLRRQKTKLVEYKKKALYYNSRKLF